MPIEFAVLGLLTESLDKIVKVVVGGGQLADFKHITSSSLFSRCTWSDFSQIWLFGIS